MTTPKTFGEMTNSQLRQFIDGCHKSRAYDEQFRAATAMLNERLDKLIELSVYPALATPGLFVVASAETGNVLGQDDVVGSDGPTKYFPSALAEQRFIEVTIDPQRLLTLAQALGCADRLTLFLQLDAKQAGELNAGHRQRVEACMGVLGGKDDDPGVGAIMPSPHVPVRAAESYQDLRDEYSIAAK